MKVLIFVTQLDAGGAQRAAFNLSKELKARNHDSAVVFLYRKSPSYQNEQYQLIRADKPNLFSLLPFMLDLLKFLKKEKPDAVISFTYYSNILVQFLSRIIGVKIRIASQRNPSFSYPFLAKFIDMLGGTFNLYSHNVMVSKTVLSSFEGYPNKYLERSIVIYNGVNKVSNSLNREALRAKLRIPNDYFVLINVGRLSDQKNQRILIESVKGMDDVLLLIIGEGKLEEYLKEKALGMSNVRFLGQLDSVLVKEYLGASDLFVFPSIFEGMSNALLEALSVGLPIVASSVPAQEEVLKEGKKKYGITLDPNNHVQWRNTIISLKDDWVKRKELSTLSDQRGKQFSMRSMAEKFEELLYR